MHMGSNPESPLWAGGATFARIAKHVSRCITRCAVKGHTLGTSTWRSERHAAPFRMVQVDLITELAPALGEKQHILSAINLFILWIRMVSRDPGQERDHHGDRTLPWRVSRSCGVFCNFAVGQWPGVCRRSHARAEQHAGHLAHLWIGVPTVQPGSRGELAQAGRGRVAVLVQDYPQTWAAKPPIAGWAWNTSPEKALSGMTA